MRLLTYAPLPRLRDLFMTLFMPAASDEKLSELWCRSGDKPIWFSRSSWSLLFLTQLRRLTGKVSITICVPDFFCNSSLTLLRSEEVKVLFYSVTESLDPNFNECEHLFEQSIDIFIAVHYFGEATKLEAISGLCKKNGAWLLEDATHILKPIEGVGDFGDCIIYSQHKHFPLPDGALLVLRSGGGSEKVYRSCDTHPPGKSSVINLFVMVWLLKRIIQCLGFRSSYKNVKFNDLMGGGYGKFPSMGMSNFSRRLLTLLIGGAEEMAKSRIANVKLWHQTLSWAGFEKLTALKNEFFVPYLMKIHESGNFNALSTFDIFQKAKLPVTTWPDLPPEVLAESHGHHYAILSRVSQFYLPAHQSILPAQIIDCGKRLIGVRSKEWSVYDLSSEEWLKYSENCRELNLYQSSEYGAAKARAEGWGVNRLLVVDELKRPVALMQALTKVIPYVGGAVRLNRGPILLGEVEKNVQTNIKLMALDVFLREARKRRWWLIRVAPELPKTLEVFNGLRALGFKKLKTPSWASGLLDLNATEDELLMRLSGKWRNSMRKGYRMGLEVVRQENVPQVLSQLINSYGDLQKNRGFNGLSKKLLCALAENKTPNWGLDIFFAYDGQHDNDLPLGILTSIRFGGVSMYLIGSVNEKGRAFQANSVLLWESILYAKKSGCKLFDIGGMNSETPKGVADFKRGLNSNLYEIAGEWQYIINPWGV
jgi:lipid II:glycine glycyltransferase (peptidoglycan interpeptide bridge formation enzyme)